MIKLISFLTFALILGAAAASLLTLPDTNAVAARDGIASASCPLRQVALDEGYGVTRVAMRPVCGGQ